jgi:hypothetical protein
LALSLPTASGVAQSVSPGGAAEARASPLIML